MAKSIIVHGGAWNIPDHKVEANKQGVGRAAETCWAVPERGGSAPDAVVAVILDMEEDATFDAGEGSILTRDCTDAMTAAQLAVERLERVNGNGGIVLIDSNGHIGWAHNTPRMARAYKHDQVLSLQVEV